MRFEETYKRHNKGHLTEKEAADLLGIHERTFWRWCIRYEAEGTSGLLDRRLGKASEKAVPVDEVMRMVALLETQYPDFTVKHVHEKWRELHGGRG